jgi:hypothetical protein
MQHGALARARGRDGWPALYLAAMHAGAELAAAPPGEGQQLPPSADRPARRIVTALLDAADGEMRRRVPGLHAALGRLPDFVLLIRFSFHTWVPLLGRLLPSDTAVVTKHGTGLRLDCTLAGMALSGLSWKRGRLSFIFPGADGA